MSSSITKQNFLTLSTESTDQKGEQKQFLKFHLEPETQVMLPLANVTEVLKIPLGKIVPIPQMPPWVMGVYNWRGEILWTVDLGHLIGLHTWYQQQKNNTNYNTTNYSVIVLSSGRKGQKKGSSTVSLGLIVTQVEDIEWCNPDLIQSPPASAVTTELAPFLQGYFLQPDGQMILVLNGNSIISAMPKT